jgi:hypothetical protein
LGIDAVQLIELDPLQTEVTKAQHALLAQVLRPAKGLPDARSVTGEARLGGDDQVLRVGVQSSPDQLLGYEGAIRVGGIDEVDAQFDGPGENAQGLFRISGFAPDSGAGQLHGAEAEPVDPGLSADFEGARGGNETGGHGIPFNSRSGLNL